MHLWDQTNNLGIIEIITIVGIHVTIGAVFRGEISDVFQDVVQEDQDPIFEEETL